MSFRFSLLFNGICVAGEASVCYLTFSVSRSLKIGFMNLLTHAVSSPNNLSELGRRSWRRSFVNTDETLRSLIKK
jgi:hypothetical protein